MNGLEVKKVKTWVITGWHKKLRDLIAATEFTSNQYIWSWVKSRIQTFVLMYKLKSCDCSWDLSNKMVTWLLWRWDGLITTTLRQCRLIPDRKSQVANARIATPAFHRYIQQRPKHDKYGDFQNAEMKQHIYIIHTFNFHLKASKHCCSIFGANKLRVDPLPPSRWEVAQHDQGLKTFFCFS